MSTHAKLPFSRILLFGSHSIKCTVNKFNRRFIKIFINQAMLDSWLDKNINNSQVYGV